MYSMRASGSLVLIAFLVTACAGQPRQGMYWGNYETSYYDLENTPGDRSQQRHLDALRNIVMVSDSRGWAPPPGTLLELANYERQLGNQQRYAYYVNRERELYPESHTFIRRWFADVLPPVTLPEQSTDDVTDEPSATVEEQTQ